LAPGGRRREHARLDGFVIFSQPDGKRVPCFRLQPCYVKLDFVVLVSIGSFFEPCAEWLGVVVLVAILRLGLVGSEFRDFQNHRRCPRPGIGPD
jgi:hypothetical protein